MAGPLAGCVASLQSSISLLTSSISILDTGVNDFPRLAKVLETTRVSVAFPPAGYFPTPKDDVIAWYMGGARHFVHNADH